jgi:hypothetical protein
MRHLLALKSLRDLDLGATAVREADVRELARALPRLEITGEGWRVPASDEHGHQGRADASGEPPGAARLAGHKVRLTLASRAGEKPSVAALYMDDSDLTDRDLSCLAGWELRSVNLRGANLTPAVLQYLRADATIEALSLHVVGCGVDSADVGPLEGKQYLYYLCIEASRISDGALERISQLAALANLDLGGCSITDSGLTHLCGAECLSTLCLAGSKVTSTGLNRLTALKNLRFLDVSGAAVAKADVKRLHEAIPKLNICGGSGKNTWLVEGARGKSNSDNSADTHLNTSTTTWAE